MALEGLKRVYEAPVVRERREIADRKKKDEEKKRRRDRHDREDKVRKERKDGQGRIDIMA